MPFPTTPVLEPFTGTGALSASWTAPAFTGEGVPERFSNTMVAPASTFSSALWNAETFGVDVEAYMSSPSGATAQDTLILYSKIKNPNLGNACRYEVVFDFINDDLEVRRQYAGSLVNIATPLVTLSVGDKIGTCVRVGATDIVVETWADSGSGWTLRHSHTDVGAVATYPLLASGGGNIGMNLYGGGLTSTTRFIDDFGGGTVVTSLVSDTPMPIMGRGATW